MVALDEARAALESETCVPIRSETEIVVACQKGRALSAQLGMTENEQVVIVIVISEVTRNILKYARHGQLYLGLERQAHKRSLVIIAHDQGPGIANVEQALQDGFSTGQGLGLGLPGARRLVDEFTIASQVGQGTTVVLKKWAPC